MNGSLFWGSDSAFILFCLITIFLWNVCKIILNQSSNNRWWPSFAGTWQERFKVHSHWTVPLWMFCYSTSLFLLWANEPHSLFSIGFCIKCKFSSASGYELKYKLLLSSLQQKLAVGICLVYIKYQIFLFACNNWENSVSEVTEYSCEVFFWKKWSHFSALENYHITSRGFLKVMCAVSLSYKGADKAECWSSRNASQREVLIRLSLAGRRAVERMLEGEYLLGTVTSLNLLFLRF